MADGFSMSMKGLQEVDENLVRLGAVAGEKVMRSVMFTATKPILDATQAGLAVVPRGSGALRRATRRVFIRPKALRATFAGLSLSSGSSYLVAIAPKSKDSTAIALANLYYKRKRRIHGVFWGHLLEWGHRLPNGGRVRGLGIFTKAAASNASKALQLFSENIGKRVQAALKRAGK